MNAIFNVGGKVIVSDFSDEVADVTAAAQALLAGGTLPVGAELVATNVVLPTDFANHEWLWQSGGLVKDQAVATERLLIRLTASIQSRLDEFARTRNYDNILSACTYATSAVPKFKAEGQYCVQARDATWAAAYEVMDKVKAGNWPSNGAHQMPADIADIASALPSLVWPAT